MTKSHDTILVVDDSPAGLYFKAHILRRVGYTVFEAPTGQAAIEQCRSMIPAIALLDVRLPDMNGVDLCRQLKAEIPGIVVLQTSAAATSAHDRALALEGGADSFLVEPIEPEELRAVTHALLRLRAAEQGLRRMNETLEQVVTDRTSELRDANQKLEVEIAERRKAEEALWHAQKLEAIGQLTGGIAHDFNNLLAVIVGGLEMVRNALESEKEIPRPKMVKLVSAAQTAADRGAKLTNQLLAFARRSTLKAEIVELHGVFATSEPLFRRALGETIALSVSLPADLWHCELDLVQFEAAILNLLVNARDAMPDGGTVAIVAENVERPALDPATTDAPLQGPCVCISVADTGTGMTPDTMARVFDPFFTTKEVGKGTGLGLSQVYGFVSQSGGGITLQSARGEGTTFRLYLPRAEPASRPASAAVVPVEVACTGSETVLVVEDNDEVREMVVALLTDFGYHVFTAADGAAALSLLRQRPVDLLFSDVVMPGGMNGYELVRQARAMTGPLKALLTSGYTNRTALDPDEPTVPLLLKPYKRTELAARIRGVLDQQ